MEIKESNESTAQVLALAGRLDGLASPELERKVDAVFSAGARRLVLDCSQLAYVSSAGLRVFLATAKRFKAAGGKAVFAGLTGPVREIFELSGFLGVLEVYPDAATAAASAS